MSKKRTLLSILTLAMVLTGCGNIDKGTTNVDPKKTGSKATVSTGRIDNSVYQSLMVDGKYETSSARGMSASRLNSNYNLTNFENGLLHLSQEQFSVDEYFFREGQEIDEDTLRSWLYRKSESNPKGLNPKNEAQPIIFQQLLEQDFIKKDSQTVGGISLGIALNRIYYSEEGEVEIDREVMIEEGKKIG